MTITHITSEDTRQTIIHLAKQTAFPILQAMTLGTLTDQQVVVVAKALFYAQNLICERDNRISENLAVLHNSEYEDGILPEDFGRT